MFHVTINFRPYETTRRYLTNVFRTKRQIGSYTVRSSSGKYIDHHNGRRKSKPTNVFFFFIKIAIRARLGFRKHCPFRFRVDRDDWQTFVRDAPHNYRYRLRLANGTDDSFSFENQTPGERTDEPILVWSKIARRAIDFPVTNVQHVYKFRVRKKTKNVLFDPVRRRCCRTSDVRQRRTTRRKRLRPVEKKTETRRRRLKLSDENRVPDERMCPNKNRRLGRGSVWAERRRNSRNIVRTVLILPTVVSGLTRTRGDLRK